RRVSELWRRRAMFDRICRLGKMQAILSGCVHCLSAYSGSQWFNRSTSVVETPTGASGHDMYSVIIAALLAVFAIAANAQGYAPPPPQYGPAANVHYGWAEVLRTDPVYGTVAQAPQQQCYPQTVTREDNNHTG